MLLLVTPFSLSHDGEKVDLIFFYSTGCPHCESMKIFLDEIEPKYEHLNIERYELKDNIELFFEYAEKYDLELGNSVSVPITFIHKRVFSGFNDEIGRTIESYASQCIAEVCGVLPDHVDDSTTTIAPGTIFPRDNKLQLTIPAVIGAAAVDAINPCAFAVLIILLTTILASGIRKKALFAGLAFSLSIFISYFLMGIGAYSAIQFSGVSHIFYTVVAILAIIIGLFNLKDYLWYGRWFIMEVPLSWRPRMKAVIKGITSVPGAFLIGFVVSLFLLPCTSGPYIVILGLLAKVATRQYALLLLLLYNFIFILPMLIITAAIYFGLITTEKAEEWRQRKLKILHLIAGIIILLLGIGMLIALKLGMI